MAKRGTVWIAEDSEHDDDGSEFLTGRFEPPGGWSARFDAAPA